MVWTIFCGFLVVKVKNGGNNGGDMMYDYGLDHEELGEHFFVLIECPLMCEGRSSLYGQ